ncbi:MAG TPA: amidase family protein, partial [Ktedonobacterales bacterium]|nr:amidase family protein [Ktedonobacterales bacterium]
MLAHLIACCESARELQAVSVPSKLNHPSARAGGFTRRIARRKPIKMTNDNRTTRRQFVAQTAAALALTGVGGSQPAPAAPANETLLALTSTEATRALKSGDISAESYATALLHQCQRGANLNAFITLRPDNVLEAARDCDRRRRTGAKLGLLHGLPIPIKDSINTKDLPTTAGTPALRHFQPSEDAPLVQALRKAGAIVLGKT